MKKLFDPDWRDLPNAFLTTTKKGKQVYRMQINVDEILSRLEEGKSHICIDVITNKQGYPQIRQGSKNGKSWRSFPYYGWAQKKEKKG